MEKTLWQTLLVELNMLKQKFRDVQKRRAEREEGKGKAEKNQEEEEEEEEEKSNNNWPNSGEKLKKDKTTAEMKKKKNYKVSMGEKNQMKS